MSPYTKAVCSVLPKIKADTKLFLVLMLAEGCSSIEGSEQNLIRKSGLDLCRQFRFTKDRTFSSLKQLEEQGFIESITQPGRLGRPHKFRRVVSGKVVNGGARLKVIKAELEVPCRRLIERRHQSPKEFNIGNALFMLLLVLLMEADQTGVVDGASHANLSAQSGIPKNQIPRRLKQLQEADLIVDVVPGLVEGAVLGKPNSIYYLNLDHAYLKLVGLSAKPIPVSGKGCDFPEVRQLVQSMHHRELNERLADATEAAKGPIQNKMTKFNPHSWARNAPHALDRASTRLYIQSVIERYAARLLNNPDRIRSATKWRETQDHASGDFTHLITKNRPSVRQANTPQGIMILRLYADLEELSHQLAQICRDQAKLPRTRLLKDYGTTAYRILPSGTENRSAILLEKITIER